jgi:actin-like ATPase involved in cell morphogenesis
LAQLHGLSEYLVDKLGVPVACVDEPEKAVIKGLATALEHLEEFRESLGYQL